MKINKDDIMNKEFYCDEAMKFTTYSKCLKCCSKPNREQCANKKLSEDVEIDEEIASRKEYAKNAKCPKCGSSYIIDNPFCFMCGDCGHILCEEDEEDEEE